MAELSEVVVVNITKESRGVTRQGFGVPLLLSPHIFSADRVLSYTSSSGVSTDFGTDSAEYKAAQIAFSQDFKPSSFLIGRQRVGAIQSQVATLATPSLSFTITITEAPQGGDTVAYVFQEPDGTQLFTTATSSTPLATIATNLAAAINADLDYNAVAVGAVITVTTSLTVFSGVVYTSIDNENGAPYIGHQFAVGGAGAYVLVVEDATGARPTVVAGIIAAETAAQVAARIVGIVNDGDNANIFGTLATAVDDGSGLYHLVFDASQDYATLEVDTKQTLIKVGYGRGNALTGVGPNAFSLGELETATAALTLITQESKVWYGLATMIPSFGNFSAEADIQDSAKDFIESNKRLYVALTTDVNVIDTTDGADTTTIAARYKAASVGRTAVFYHDKPEEFADVAWLARMLPTDPGSATWKFKTLRNVTFSNLTSTQATNALAKNANTYENFAGTNITREGTVASGEFIDVVVGLDWVVANMEADIFDGLASAPKIPFTDKGIGIIGNLVRARLLLAVGQGIFSDNPAPEVILPKVADVDPADKAARLLRTVEWTATLQGAIHKVNVEGFVSI